MCVLSAGNKPVVNLLTPGRKRRHYTSAFWLGVTAAVIGAAVVLGLLLR